ncbi:MAG: hypothetical protein IPM06_18615 [Rhizobiales bacterium]|nr:hypothetical protein [Hyphomicrobiales bacterium]
MPDVNRIQLLGQDDGEDSLNQVQDVGGKAMVELRNLIPGKTSTPRGGIPRIAENAALANLDWVYPFRSTLQPELTIGKIGVDLVQIDQRANVVVIRSKAFPSSATKPCAERVGDTVIVSCDYPSLATTAWAVTQDGRSLKVRPANIERSSSTVISAAFNQFSSAFMNPKRAARMFSTTWVMRDDDGAMSPTGSGVPGTTYTWGEAKSESWEDLNGRFIFGGEDLDGEGELEVTVTVSNIPEGATHLRMWCTKMSEWEQLSGNDAAATIVAGLSLRWWMDISIADRVVTPNGIQFTQKLNKSEGSLAGEINAVDTTGANEVPPCRSMRYLNGLLWACGAKIGDSPGRCYYSLDVTGTSPLRSLSLFNLTDRAIDTSQDDTEQSMGLASTRGHLIIINERDVWMLDNGDPDNQPRKIAEDMGTLFPGTICEHNQMVWYLSSQGPARISGDTVELVEKFSISDLWPSPDGGDPYFHALSRTEKASVWSVWHNNTWYIGNRNRVVGMKMSANKIEGGFRVTPASGSGVVTALPARMSDSRVIMFGGGAIHTWMDPNQTVDGNGFYFTAEARYRIGRIDGRRWYKVAEAYDILAHAHWDDDGDMLTTVESQGDRYAFLFKYEQRPITDALQNSDISNGARWVIQQGLPEGIIGAFFVVGIRKIVRGPFILGGMEIGIVPCKGHEFEYVSFSSGQVIEPELDGNLLVFDPEFNRGYDG